MANTFSYHQYVRKILKWGFKKYKQGRKSPLREAESATQNSSELQLVFAQPKNPQEPYLFDRSRQEEDLAVDSDDRLDNLASENFNDVEYPSQYAPDPSESHRLPYWAPVGNAALLMQQDTYAVTRTVPHLPPVPCFSQAEMMIPLRRRISSQYGYQDPSVTVSSHTQVTRQVTPSTEKRRTV
jgi:hypothetical protein